jgi:hypothetical protein
MSGIPLAQNFNVKVNQVIDNRCVGLSADNNAIAFKATGLLRYETDTDSWKYYDGTSFVSFGGLPTRIEIPVNESDMTKVLMEGHLNGGIGDTGALWKQLSLKDLSGVEYISLLNMYRISNGLIVKGNFQTEDESGVSNFIVTPTGDVTCNDITCSDIIHDTLSTTSLKARTKEYTFNLLHTAGFVTVATISRDFFTNTYRSCMVEICMAYATNGGEGTGGASYVGNFRYIFQSDGSRDVDVYPITTLYNNGGIVVIQFVPLTPFNQASGVQVQFRNYEGATLRCTMSMKIVSNDYFNLT